MQFEYMEPWAQFGRMSCASLKELGEISTKAFEKMVEQQRGLVSTYVDTGIKQVTLLTGSKGYKDLMAGHKDLMAGQTKLMTEYNEKMLNAVSKTTEIVTDSKDEMTAWFEKTLESGAAPVKKAALAVKKATD